MKEILSGIYQITIPLPGFYPDTVNSFLLRSGNEYFLIDTPWDTPNCSRSFEEQLAQIGISLSDINNVIITHAHTDHLGMLYRLKTEYNVNIFINTVDIDFLRSEFMGSESFISETDNFLSRHGVPQEALPLPEVNLPSSGKLQSLEFDHPVAGGDEISGAGWVLRVIDTPGHSPGHMSLYEPVKKILFSGDMLLPTIATNASVHVRYMENPLKQYMKSLDVLKGLDVNLVLPGHEEVFSNHRQRISELIKLHNKRANRIMKTFNNSEPKTAFEVAVELSRSSRKKSITWDTMNGWERRFLVLQTIAYLQELTGDEKLKRHTEKGITYYTPSNK